MTLLAFWTYSAFLNPMPEHAIYHDSVTVDRVPLESFDATTSCLVDDHVLRCGHCLVRRRNHCSHPWYRYSMIRWMQNLLRCVVVGGNLGVVNHESLNERWWAVPVSARSSVFVCQV